MKVHVAVGKRESVVVNIGRHVIAIGRPWDRHLTGRQNAPVDSINARLRGLALRGFGVCVLTFRREP